MWAKDYNNVAKILFFNVSKFELLPISIPRCKNVRTSHLKSTCDKMQINSVFLLTTNVLK